MPVAPPEAGCAYRAVGHQFAVECPDRRLGEYLEQLLAPLADVDLGNNAYAVAWGDGGYAVSLNGAVFASGLAERDVVDALLGYVNIRAVGATPSHLLVHAGAVARDGRAVVLPAASGSGKTSLTIGLVAAGLRYLTDETAAIDVSDLHVVPYRKPMTVKAAGQHVFAHLCPAAGSATERYTSDAAWQVDPRRVHPDALAHAAPAYPVLLVSPRFVAGATTTVEAMTRAQAMVELGANSSALHALGPRVLEVLERVSWRAPAYRLVFGDLAEAVAEVLRLLDGAR